MSNESPPEKDAVQKPTENLSPPLSEDELSENPITEQVVSSVSVQSHHQSLVISQGPLPSPENLTAYEKILPGSAERFLTLVENETSHRQKMEIKLCDAEIDDRKTERSERRLGQILGFSIGIIAIISGSVVAILGRQITTQVVGGVIGGGSVAGLVAVFIYGRLNQRQESEETDDEE
ncbi:hypothetical protein MNBD_PLANCTO02-1758 [hydrothermal vent metagenome]|uniref:DUF2335 domain-containing protein n=1 Tax=hydrothermal vent metagenome TaxID=652676 RepID=A0A3B1DRP4_9ZZZZ